MCKFLTCLFPFFSYANRERKNDLKQILELSSSRGNPLNGLSFEIGAIPIKKTLELRSREQISRYRLEWPILEFQPVKGVHIRSFEAGNVLSPFRCPRSNLPLFAASRKISLPPSVSLSSNCFSFFL